MTTFVLMDEETYWIYHLHLSIDMAEVRLRLTHSDGRAIPDVSTITLVAGPFSDDVSRRFQCSLRMGHREVSTRVVNILNPQAQA